MARISSAPCGDTSLTSIDCSVSTAWPTPGGVDHAYQQHDRADQHYHALHRVVEHAGAKAAIGGIQRDADPEDQQAGIVRNTGSRLQQAGAADKLDGHGADKGHQQTQAGQPDQQATLIARKQHVIEGDSIIATRKDGEFSPARPATARWRGAGSSPAAPSPGRIYRRRRVRR